MSLLLDALKQAEENKKKSSNHGEVLSKNTDEIESTPLVLEEPGLTQEDSGDSEISVKDTETVVEAPLSEQSDESRVESKRAVDNLSVDPALNVFAAGGVRESTRLTKHGLLGLLLLVVMILLFLFWLGDDNSSYSTSVDEKFIDNDVEVVNEPSTVALEKSTDDIHETLVKTIEQTQESTGLTEQVDEVIEAPSSPIAIKKSNVNRRLFALLGKGYDALQSGRYKEAEGIYENVLIKQPKQVDALLGLAHIYSQNNDLIQARQLYDRVLTIEPANKIAQLGLMYTYQSDNSAKGLELLQELSEKHPKNADILVAIGHKLAKKSKWSDAQQYYFRAYSAQPENALFAYNLAVSLDRMEKYDAAIGLYKKALMLNSISSPVINNRKVMNRVDDLEHFR